MTNIRGMARDLIFGSVAALTVASGVHAQTFEGTTTAPYLPANTGLSRFDAGSVRSLDPTRDLVSISRVGPPSFLYCCGLGEVTTSYVPLSAFASSADVAQLARDVAASNSDVAQLARDIARHAYDVSQLAYFMRRDAQRVSEGIALASALTVLPPEPGDRFAVTISAAAFDSEVAGSVSVSYRPAPGVILFGGYARSQTQNLYKGGASFSFK